MRNFRDAGLLSGLARGRAFRSDDPRYNPFGSCRRLRSAGIKTIVKLNAFQHRVRYGFRPYWRKGPCGLRELVVSLPYGRSMGSHRLNIYAIGRRDLSAARMRVVYHMERQLGLMFKELARLKPHQLPLLIHCSLGRDRAGVVLALMQRLAGASRAAVERDYLASRATVGHVSVRSLRLVLGRMGSVRRFMRQALGLNYWDLMRIRRMLRPRRVSPRPETSSARRAAVGGP